jgi:hypothetical protein
MDRGQRACPWMVDLSGVCVPGHVAQSVGGLADRPVIGLLGGESDIGHRTGRDSDLCVVCGQRVDCSSRLPRSRAWSGGSVRHDRAAI